MIVAPPHTTSHDIVNKHSHWRQFIFKSFFTFSNFLGDETTCTAQFDDTQGHVHGSHSSSDG